MRMPAHNDIERFGFSETPTDHQPDRQFRFAMSLIALVAMASLVVSASAWSFPLATALRIL